MKPETSFEYLLERYRVAVERYVNFRMPSKFDADDVIGETYYEAFRNFSKLKNFELFKPWILSIARNQCNLWYRKKYNAETVSLDILADVVDTQDNCYDDSVINILRQLPRDSAELLRLTMYGYKQSEIADHLGISVGTVKSRLHYAKKKFRAACEPEQISIFEKGRMRMERKDYACGFPDQMPKVVIKESMRPFFEVKCEEESFIIPRIGNRNSEGTYRYPDRKLAVVSTCYVPKTATVHGVHGVKVCRDTYNVKANKLYKNEAVWFTQLTDEYIRDLGTIVCDADDEIPTAVCTFLEEDYDIIVNGNDRVHGRPLIIKENPPQTANGKIYVDVYNVRYTMGTFDVTIGDRSFETVKFINPQMNTVVTENYVDISGKVVLMRWYESVLSLENDENYSDEFIKRTSDNPTIIVNDTEYRLIEDRISQYAL